MSKLDISLELRFIRNWLLVGFLFSSLTMNAQEEVLKRIISGNIPNISQVKALEIIEQLTQIRFSYPSSLIDKNKKVDLIIQEEPLDKVLRRIFEGKDIQFKVIESRILITEVVKKSPPKKKTIHGYIKDSQNGEALIGASIFLSNNQSLGTNTNAYGYFSLSLPQGSYELQISYLGYLSKKKSLILDQNKRLDFQLSPNSEALETVIVTAAANVFTEKEVRGGWHQLNTQKIKKMPAIGGEPDLFKSIQLLPGVGSAGEGSTGLYVRGGNIDQNLVLLDEALIYNPSHLLGFFSTFHPDAIQHMEVYKGNFPAKYGGRLSSVVDLRMKEGNKEELKVKGGIGLLASRLLVEGPIKKDKHSFMLAARRTYPDLFLFLTEDDGGNKVNFSDFNLKTNWKLTESDRLFFSMYRGSDVFRFFDAYENKWGNTTATLRWNHLFNEKTFANFSLIFNDYKYSVANFISGAETLDWNSGISDWNIKMDFSKYINSQSRIDYGMQHILHRLNPGNESENRLNPVPESKTLEQAIYFDHEIRFNPRFTLSYGLRLSANHNFGKNKVYQFNEQFDIIDSTLYSGGIFHSRFNWSPRIHFKYKVGSNAWLNGGYSRMAQYIYQLRNTTTAFNAFYTFMPSNPNIPAQTADQLSLGFTQKNTNNNLQWSVEGYFKWLHQQIDFRDHAQLLQNPFIEGELRFGSGKAYGLELTLQKRSGPFNGFLSYTYSRSLREIGNINDGRAYPTYYDQPHAAKLWLNYKTQKRWEFALNWQLISGRSTTLPIGSFEYQNTIIPLYGDRNSQRLPTFHRLDLSITLNGKNKKQKDRLAYWVFTIYNVYHRKNTLSIDILPKKEKGTDNIPNPLDVGAFKTYVSGIFPSLSYNFSF